MTDIDSAVGADDNETIMIRGKSYRIAPFGPYLLGEIINYVKKRRRTEIIETANAMAETSFVKVSEFVSKELAEINEDTLDEFLSDMDVLTHLVFYNLKVWQPDLLYSDMGKYFTVELITEVAALIMSDLPTESKGEDGENPTEEQKSEPVGQ